MNQTFAFRMATLLLAAFLLVPCQGAQANDGFAHTHSRVVFLGDSITHSGRYIAILEARLEKLGHDCTLINLGLPSETCSGLSENDHPFPRPSVQSRLDRALELSKPDVVVACYGMNDGIYHPFSEERFAAYRNGINIIVQKANTAGAKVVLMSPPPFDAQAVRAKGKSLLPANANDFSYKRVYEDYDRVMSRYARWITEQSDRVDQVIDLHTAVSDAISARRKKDPDFVMAGDGVHPSPEGHLLIADAICGAWDLETVKVSPSDLATIIKRQSILHNAWLSHVGHDRPGMKPGLPLKEAREQAEAITSSAR